MGNTLTRVLEGQSTYGDSRPCVGFMLDDRGTQIETTPISRSGRPLRKARLGVSTRILRDLGLALLAADSYAKTRSTSAEGYSACEREPRGRRWATSAFSRWPAEANGHARPDEVLPRR